MWKKIFDSVGKVYFLWITSNRLLIWRIEILWTQRFALQFCIYTSSRPELFCKKYVLRNFAKFPGKHLCQSLFFNKVAALRPVTLSKKRFWHRCFPGNFAKFLRTLFLQNTSGSCFCNKKTHLVLSFLLKIFYFFPR